MPTHNPGKLKQTNKKHKGSTSKRAFRSGQGAGKVSSSGKTSVKEKVSKDARSDRINRAKQIQKVKRTEVMLQRRVGSNSGPPKVVGIIPLTPSANIHEMLQQCLSEASWHSSTEAPVIYAQYAKHKAKCAYVGAGYDLFSAIDVARISDVLLFVVNYDDCQGDQILNEDSLTTISALKTLGLPNTFGHIQNMLPNSHKHYHATKKQLESYLEYTLTTEVKFVDSADLLARALANVIPHGIVWKSMRSYIVADAVQQQGDKVQLKGYLRGAPMHVNSLMHIVNVGTVKLESVELLAEPYNSHHKITPQVLHADPNKQDSLAMEAVSDVLMGEQTWPSEEEMGGTSQSRRHIPSNIPAGMSDIQADWYMDDEGNFDAELSDEDGEMEEEEVEEIGDVASDHGVIEDDGDDDMTVAESVMDAQKDAAEEKRRLRQLADEDAQFPDEMDTPEDVAARERFARYRALQSFRSSPWHPKENLPADYSRIFQFENFNLAQKRALADIKAVQALQDSEFLEKKSPHEQTLLVQSTDDYVKSGSYVVITLNSVTADVSKLPLTSAFSLCPYENKLSVLNFSVQRHGSDEDTIKSKDELIFMNGFRTFTSRPVFSEPNLNCDKHKLERFLRSDRVTMASTFGPISYLPSPVLIFKRTDAGTQLVASGTLASIDPDRIVLKKVVLTGIPIRVKKKHAVVKHLFYNPMDVRWFKPAELVTKYGIRGNIRMPVGTHGLFKAIFSAPIKQNDTVMLVLYKRVFPKFPEQGAIECH